MDGFVVCFHFFFQSSWVLIIKVNVLQAAYTCGFFFLSFFNSGYHSVFNWNLNLVILM